MSSSKCQSPRCRDLKCYYWDKPFTSGIMTAWYQYSIRSQPKASSLKTFTSTEKILWEVCHIFYISSVFGILWRKKKWVERMNSKQRKGKLESSSTGNAWCNTCVKLNTRFDWQAILWQMQSNITEMLSIQLYVERINTHIGYVFALSSHCCEAEEI